MGGGVYLFVLFYFFLDVKNVWVLIFYIKIMFLYIFYIFDI